MKNYTVGFYLEKLYYSPHFEPVIREVIKRGITYVVIIPRNLGRDVLDQREASIRYCEQEHFIYSLDEDDCTCEVMVFGNIPRPLHTKFQQSALIMHGAWGGKTVNTAASLNQVDIRFLDGNFMKECLTKIFPEKESIYYVSGYSKLDSYFRFSDEDRIRFLERCGLDVNKKTILYAPTFYPSSVLRMSKRFPEDLSDYNIILKPHSHVFLRKRYRKDLHFLESWEKYPNVYLAKFDETNILPFLHVADVMISDMSSAAFEFAGVGKPVVINQFLRYRFWHRLFPRQVNKRLDRNHFHLWHVGDTPKSYPEMLCFVKANLLHPDRHKEQREKLVRYVLGDVDGKVSERIVDKILELTAVSLN